MKSNQFRFLWGVLCALVFIPTFLFAQTQATISGNVKDKTSGNALPGVSIAIKGSNIGTVTNNSGNFTLKTAHAFPLTLVLSFVGYKTEEVAVTGPKTDISVQLASSEILGLEVVVAASRVQESILKSPVSIEKLDSRAIKNSPAPTFYDALANLKGVEMSTQSLTFKSVNTRGFNANGNTRVLQLTDGMDNQAPGLNFSVGNIVGISELDMDNVELIPGAASALYGPNALNGIVLLNSKNPFQYQGLSANVKTGILSESGRTTPTTGYYDIALRYAKAFNNKFAFKVNFGYLKADDWQAYDKRDQSLQNGHNLQNGTRANNEAYNGVNVYGDEHYENMTSTIFSQANTPTTALAQQLAYLSGTTFHGTVTPQQIIAAAMPASANGYVTRTGYDESSVADYNTKNLKFNAALHYKIHENLEALIQGSYGTGTTVYTGADRYSIKNFRMGQYKAELKGSNFYVRLYTTQERSGDSYAIGTLASGINEAWKTSQQWYGEYFSNYTTAAVGAFAQAYGAALAGGANPADALTAATAAVNNARGTIASAARTQADKGRLLPGTPEFNAAADKVKSKPIPGDATGVGARFMDKTNLYQGEFMYNFKDLVKFAEILIGGNYRVYALNSEKTLFAVDDNGNEFRVKEYGGYAQIMKNILNEHVKLTGSIRYDKNQNFKGQFSPRLSAVYTFLQSHNIRASYQTGFRIPTNQDQYIDLQTPQAHLIGGLPFLRERYHLNTGPLYTLESVQAGKPAQYTFRDYEPERIRAWEVGYKGLFANRVLVDAYVYTNNFKNFNGPQILVQPTTTGQNIFSVPVSFDKDIKSWGWALGIDYTMPQNFVAGGNISYNELLNANDLGSFLPMYNTPKVRYNLYVGNRNIAKSNIGVNVTWRWQDKFIWQSSFVNNIINVMNLGEIPAYGTLDAQVTKLFPKVKTTVKLGGANILNKQYIQSWGNPTVGSQWYISLGYNL